MSKIKTNFRPSKNSESGKGKLVVLILLVAGFLFVKGFVEDSENAPSNIQTVQTNVHTIQITLKPGERKVFSTKDPQTGKLCRYVAVWGNNSDDGIRDSEVWGKHSNKSTLMTSVHNHLGKNGVGGRISSAYTFPKSYVNLHYGDYENENIYFVCVHNIGPDEVSFSVELIGSRQVTNQIVLEKE